MAIFFYCSENDEDMRSFDFHMALVDLLGGENCCRNGASCNGLMSIAVAPQIFTSHFAYTFSF